MFDNDVMCSTIKILLNYHETIATFAYRVSFIVFDNPSWNFMFSRRSYLQIIPALTRWPLRNSTANIIGVLNIKCYRIVTLLVVMQDKRHKNGLESLDRAFYIRYNQIQCVFMTDKMQTYLGRCLFNCFRVAL